MKELGQADGVESGADRRAQDSIAESILLARLFSGIGWRDG